MPLRRNDPCHCGSGKKYKRCHLDADSAVRSATDGQPTSESEIDASLPDRRALESSVAQIGALFGGRTQQKRRPVDAAQEIMYRAWESRNTEQRIALAREALDASPDCADAYVLLAEEAARSDVASFITLFSHVPEHRFSAMAPDLFLRLNTDSRSPSKMSQIAPKMANAIGATAVSP